MRAPHRPRRVWLSLCVALTSAGCLRPACGGSGWRAPAALPTGHLLVVPLQTPDSQPLAEGYAREIERRLGIQGAFTTIAVAPPARIPGPRALGDEPALIARALAVAAETSGVDVVMFVAVARYPEPTALELVTIAVDARRQAIVARYHALTRRDVLSRRRAAQAALALIRALAPEDGGCDGRARSAR